MKSFKSYYEQLCGSRHRFHPEEGEYGFFGSRAPSGEQAPYLTHSKDPHAGFLPCREAQKKLKMEKNERKSCICLHMWDFFCTFAP